MTVWNLVIIAAAAVLLSLLLYFEKGERRAGMVPAKTTLSLLFIVAVLLQSHPIQGYYLFVLIGLIFCLWGDVFLALPQEKAFMLGLVSFLLGHVSYVFGFTRVAATGPWFWLGSLGTWILSGGVYLWLRPHLGRMNVPVLSYMIVITLMVSGAWGMLGNRTLDLAGRILALCGALCFYFSDVFVARDRFLVKAFINRLVGLPMYYAGQFLLAFSVGLMK